MRQDVDNRKEIKKFIEEFFSIAKYSAKPHHPLFVVQCLQRKKDGCEFDNKPVYQRTIDRVDKIDTILDKAVEVAEKYNARVYINTSPKEMTKVALRCAQDMINVNLNNGTTKSLESIMYSSILKSGCSMFAYHIFDIDTNDENDLKIFMNWVDDNFLEDDYLLLPTISGYHFIVPADDYTTDTWLDTLNNDMKDLITRIYMTNNHLDEKPNKHIKTMLSNIIHKESGNTLVYYKHTLH